MQLDAFKQAAKRLRAQIAALSGKSASELNPSHSQSLDLMARVLGYRDFHEARIRLEGAPPAAASAPNTQPGPAAEPRILAITGAAGCGKTTQARRIVASALAAGIPVRILEFVGEFKEFSGILGAQVFAEAGGADFFTAWRSDAPLVVGGFKTREQAQALDFAQMSLPSDTLFICDEAPSWGKGLQPLGNLSVFVSQSLRGLPVEPNVCFAHNGQQWTMQVPPERAGDVMTGIVLESMLAAGNRR